MIVVPSIYSSARTELAKLLIYGLFRKIRVLAQDGIRADVDGDGRTEYVPHDDQTGPRPPERSYVLFATGSLTTELGTTRRFYFGGNIYEGWSTVPEQYKAPDFSRPEPGRHTVRIFAFTW